VIAALTMILLAYIMIEVGMEFDIDKSHLGQYGASSRECCTPLGCTSPWPLQRSV